MGIAVLGPIEVDGQSSGLAPRDRVVLSALVVRAGDPLSTEALADALWGDDPPASWAKVVHGCIARLRRRLGAAAIESGAAGYRLRLTETELDCRRFEQLLDRARDALSGGDPERASYLVQEALDLWRGQALADLEDWETGRVEAARLDGMRMDAEELRVEAETHAGRGRDVLEAARALVAQYPLRERRWALLARALHQSGRQAEALGALRQARAMLADQLGLDPGRELVELEALLLRQDPSLDPVLGREISAACPYRGLLPYDADDADTFFGREADLAACLRKLRDTGFVAVVGPSGVGKSSLVRAGMVASLTRNGEQVRLTTPGTRPTESLAGLSRRAHQVLVVDQAEEVFTTDHPAGEREAYFGALAAHVAAGGRLVLSIRADHLGDLAPYPDITRVLEGGIYLLGPMDEPDLRSAIEGPARRAGLRLEPGLVDLLVRDVEGEPAALPLLSHVLRETWARREGPTLTFAGYRATGGIRDAVSRTAESLYDAMDDARRLQLRSVLLRLVTATEDGDPVRARVPRAKLAADEEHRLLLEQLVNARMVSVDGDSVQIAHEALVRVWPRLRTWLDDDVEGQRLFRHLAGAADAWDAMARPESELYRGTRLARTVEWRERARPDLNDNESEFLAASTTLAEREASAAESRVRRERRTNRRLRAALVAVGALLVLTLVAGLLAVFSADRAARERDAAARDRDRAAAAADLADARRAGAQGVLHEDLATGLLLAVQSLTVDGSSQSWDNLGSVLTRAGPLVGLHDIGAMLNRPGTAHMPSVAASPDGALVAASVLNTGVYLFDADTLSLRPFLGSTGGAASVAFAPDSSQLAVVALDEGPPIRLYDVPSGTLAAAQPGGFSPQSDVEYTPTNDVDVAFSGDGSRLVAQIQQSWSTRWSAYGDVMVWDTASPSRPVLRVRLPKFAHPVLSLDGERLYVATQGDPAIRVYAVASGRLLASVRDPIVATREVTAAELSPDGSTLAVAAEDRVVRFDASTLRRRGPALTVPTGTVHDVAFDHRGQVMATAYDDGAIIWDTRTGEQLHRYVVGGIGVAFSADDETLFTAGGEGTVVSWQVPDSGRQLVLGEDTPAVDDAEYSLSLPAPDGSTVARVRAGNLWFEDTRTGRRTTGGARTEDTEFEWSSDSRWMLSHPPFGGSRVTVWDAATGEAVARSDRMPGGGDVNARFSSDARVVYVHDEQSLHTLSRASLRPENPPVLLPAVCNALLPHPTDGSVFIINCDGSFMRVDPKTGEVRDSGPSMILSGEDANGNVMSPDGTRMVGPAAGQRVRLFDVDRKQFLGAETETPFGSSATFAPDGGQFAVVQAEQIRLFDGRTGDYQASLPLPTRLGTVEIVYRPDSSGLVIASTDGRTWTADTRIADWVDRACATAGRNLSRAEWEQYFPTLPYEPTCPQWPAGT